LLQSQRCTGKVAKDVVINVMLFNLQMRQQVIQGNRLGRGSEVTWGLEKHEVGENKRLGEEI